MKKLKKILPILISILILGCSKKEEIIKYEISAPDVLNLKVGDIKTLDYSVNPEPRKEQFFSEEDLKINNTEIARIEYYPNKIKGVRAGETTVIISGEIEKQHLMKEVKIVVSDVKIQGFFIDRKDVSLKEGESITLKETLYPSEANYRTIKWSSSDESVATVNNGEVTAIKEGTCEITASVEDRKATCNVTVKPINVETIEIEASSPIVRNRIHILIGKSQQLYAKILPENAKDKRVKWHSSNDNVISISNDGVIKALSAGESEITCVSEKGDVKASLLVSSEDVDYFINTTSGMEFGSYIDSYATVYMYARIKNDSPYPVQVLGFRIVNNRKNLIYLNEPYEDVVLYPGEKMTKGINIRNEYKPNFNFTWVLKYNGRKFEKTENNSLN